MPIQINKKIFIYLLILLFLGTINNKNLNNLNIFKIKEIKVSGLGFLDDKKILRNLEFLKNQNIFFLNKNEISKILNTYNVVEKYFVSIRYPSSIDMKIVKTNFLALTNRYGKKYYFGSNGKLIESKKETKGIPFISPNNLLEEL